MNLVDVSRETAQLLRDYGPSSGGITPYRPILADMPHVDGALYQLELVPCLRAGQCGLGFDTRLAITPGGFTGWVALREPRWAGDERSMNHSCTWVIESKMGLGLRRTKRYEKAFGCTPCRNYGRGEVVPEFAVLAAGQPNLVWLGCLRCVKEAGWLQNATVNDTGLLTIGTRVQLHPVTDRWLNGWRFGTVTQVEPRSPGMVRVDVERLDQTERTLVRLEDLIVIGE